LSIEIIKYINKMKGGADMDKNILDVKIEEKDGEYVIRLSGEQAQRLVKCFPAVCCCTPQPEGKSKADASCC
jgi:hypothetical protein